MPACIIRKLYLEELILAAAVIRQSFATVANDLGLTRENCPTNGAFIQLEHLYSDWNKGNGMYGFFKQGHLIGFMELEQKNTAVYLLKKLAVLPQERHQGYGALLLAFARQAITELGGSKITIGIIAENTRLKDWYLEQGFISTGTKAYPHLPFLVGFMELTL